MRESTEVGRTVAGLTSIEGQLVKSRAPDIAIYLRTYLCAAFRCSGVNSLRVRIRQTWLDSGDSQ